MPTDLAPFDRETLEEERATICAADLSLQIVYVNRAWRDFARDNGGDAGAGGRCGVGVSLLRATPRVLRPFYTELFARARASRDAPVEHSYECSSPTVFRRFRMLIFACNAGALLIVHSLSQETPHERRASPAIEALYRDENGLLHQCSHCRRVRRAKPGADEPGDWDWVPDYVAKSAPRTSHGLCTLCARYHYPDSRA